MRKLFLGTVAITILLLSGCGILSTHTSSSEQMLPGVTKETLELHNSLMAMSSSPSTIGAEPDTLHAFRISWDLDTVQVGLIGTRIKRAEGVISENFETVGFVDHPDTQWVDTLVMERIRYVYELCYYNFSAEGDTQYSTPPNRVSGLWAVLGDLNAPRTLVSLYDTIWTSTDLIVFGIPDFQPYEIKWIQEPIEMAIWKGLYDVTGDGDVNISDLSFYGLHYNRSARDTTVGLEE